MVDALLVSGGEGVGDLGAVLERLSEGNGASVEPLPQRLAFEQLGHDVRYRCLDVDVEDGRDVGMVERPRGPRFPAEKLQVLRRSRRAIKDLQRHVTLETRIAGAIHLAHASGADDAYDLVGAETVTRRQDDGARRSRSQPGHVGRAPQGGRAERKRFRARLNGRITPRSQPG